MFKVLFFFQINNMSHVLETKIPVVIVMAKYEPRVMIIRQVQPRGTTNIPAKAFNNINIPKIPQSRLSWRLYSYRKTFNKQIIGPSFSLKMKQLIDKIIFKC